MICPQFSIILKKFSRLLQFRKGHSQPQAVNTYLEIDESSTLNNNSIQWKDTCFIKVKAESQIKGNIFFDREDARVEIGERTFIGGTLVVAEHIAIGNDVMIAWGTTVVDHNSHSIYFSERQHDVIKWRRGEKDWSYVKIAPVTISDKVWIGFNAIILKGVTLGEGAVVGAGSVVTKDVKPWTVVAGNPARLIREIAEHER